MRRIKVNERIGNKTAAEGAIWVREFGKGPRLRRPWEVEVSYIEDIYGGIALSEKTDIIVRATAVAANDVDMVAGYDLIIVRNQP